MLKNKSINAFSKLLTGAIVAQMITLLVSPLTTRLFTAEILGEYTLVLTVISIFGPVITGRYDASLITEKDDDQIPSLIAGSAVLVVLLSGVVSLGYFFVKKREINISLLVILFILLLGTGIINILTSYNNRMKKYELISKVYVKRTAAQNFLLVISGLLKMGLLGLLVSQIFGMFLGIKEQAKDIQQNKNFFKFVNCKRIKKVLKKNYKQPLYSVPATLLNTSSYSIINFFITSLFGLATFGIYSISFRILGMPLNLISNNLSRVYFQEASELAKNKLPYRKLMIKYSLLVSIISIIMTLFLILFSPALFGFVFGSEWIDAGKYVQVLAPMYGIRLVVSTVAVSIIISNKQYVDIFLQMFFIISAAGTYILTKTFSLTIYQFLGIISLTYSVVYIIYFIYIFIISGESGENCD